MQAPAPLPTALASFGVTVLGQRMANMSDGTLVPVWLTAFNAGAFDAAAFPACGMAYPAAIQSSVRKRQAEFFCGRLAARMALEDLGYMAVEVGSGSQREPLWPAGVAGSITHNGLYAAAAVRCAPALACGIDIETVASGESLAALTALALNGDELSLLGRQGAGASLARLASTVFSAKESFFKAAFPEVGRFFDFDAIALGALDLAAGKLTFTIQEALSHRLHPGAQVAVHCQPVDEHTVLTSCGW